MNLRRLSRLIPVRMTSTYGVRYTDPMTGRQWPGVERATWWQWRGRRWRHRRTEVTP